MQSTIDPRSGFVFDVRDLGRHAGGMKRATREVPAPEGFGNGVIGVPTGAPLTLELMFEAVVEGILVSGSAEAELAGECARCLTPVGGFATTDVQELFLFPDAEPDDDEASRVEADLIDLEPLLRDQLVLDMPFTPLCREDCAGLCPTCGVDLNADPAHEHGDAIDPRWAELAGWADAPKNDVPGAPGNDREKEN